MFLGVHACRAWHLVVNTDINKEVRFFAVEPVRSERIFIVVTDINKEASFYAV